MGEAGRDALGASAEQPSRLGDPTRTREAISNLQDEALQLEAQVASRSEEFRAQTQEISIESVRRALPSDAGLVELVSFSPYQPRGKPGGRWGARRYAAYVLWREGEGKWVDLGEAATIDEKVGAWRKALAEPSSADVRELGRAVDEQVMRPVRALLGATHRVFLAPDGGLNLIPFAALVDENNQYLVRKYVFTYLTSGRDLLRFAAEPESRESPILIGNPEFELAGGDGTETQPPAARGKLRSVDFTSGEISPLPGTEGEIEAIESILPDARVLTGSRATEAAVKQVAGPRVLHIATHGFFLPNQQGPAPDGAQAPAGAAPEKLEEDPLLRSGLLLAGVKNIGEGAVETQRTKRLIEIHF